MVAALIFHQVTNGATYSANGVTFTYSPNTSIRTLHMKYVHSEWCDWINRTPSIGAQGATRCSGCYRIRRIYWCTRCNWFWWFNRCSRCYCWCWCSRCDSSTVLKVQLDLQDLQENDIKQCRQSSTLVVVV